MLWLLYYIVIGDQLRFLSSTDKKFEWKNKQNRIVKEYNSTPIHQHACFSKAKRKCQSQENSKNDPAVNNSSNQGDDKDEDLGVNEGEGEEVVSTSIIKCKRPGWSTVKSLKHSKDQKKQIVEKVRARLKNSAFVKHLVGRHEPIVINHTTNVDVTYLEKQHMIFTLQRSELMENIKNIKVSYPHECCADTIKDLYCNYEEVCIQTKLHYSEWHKERRFRITGSTCYHLFSYTSNKNPDWTKKCDSFFSPKNFRSEYTDYGKKTKGENRECFRNATKKDIIETGLIISQQNPWIAYSPDGVIFKDGKPSELLEIKCPVQGKSKNIHVVVQSVIGKCLIQEGENIYLRHEYYGQVQLGMAIINVTKASFVIYSSFDKGAFILTVNFDSVFVEKLLTDLKKAYYQKMLHFICAMKLNSKNKDQNDYQNELEP